MGAEAGAALNDVRARRLDQKMHAVPDAAD